MIYRLGTVRGLRPPPEVAAAGADHILWPPHSVVCVLLASSVPGASSSEGIRSSSGTTCATLPCNDIYTGAGMSSARRTHRREYSAKFVNLSFFDSSGWLHTFPGGA